jgi:hypothetical protein
MDGHYYKVSFNGFSPEPEAVINDADLVPYKLCAGEHVDDDLLGAFNCGTSLDDYREMVSMGADNATLVSLSMDSKFVSLCGDRSCSSILTTVERILRDHRHDCYDSVMSALHYRGMSIEPFRPEFKRSFVTKGHRLAESVCLVSGKHFAWKYCEGEGERPALSLNLIKSFLAGSLF